MFKTDLGGSREGKVVLVQHREIQDVEMGGHYTVKESHSEKIIDSAGCWEHSRIVLKPKTNALGYKDIVLQSDQTNELKVLGEYVTGL